MGAAAANAGQVRTVRGAASLQVGPILNGPVWMAEPQRFAAVTVSGCKKARLGVSNGLFCGAIQTVLRSRSAMMVRSVMFFCKMVWLLPPFR